MNPTTDYEYQKFQTPAFPTPTPIEVEGVPVVRQPDTISGSPLENDPQQPPLSGGQPAAWSTGLCDCCSDVGNCCITCWCPCITFGLIAEIADKGATSCFMNGGMYALLQILCCLNFGCFCTGCICSCFYRTKIRHQYNLEESPCNDCLVHCCCECCALCQEYRELKNKGFDMAIGWHGNVQKGIGGGVAMAPTAPGMTR